MRFLVLHAATLFTATLFALLAASESLAQSVYPTGTTIWEQNLTDDGYTLFIGGGTGYLVNMDGDVVNTWVSPFPGHSLSSVAPLDNGHILAYTRDPSLGGGVRTVLELDYDGNLIWTYTLGAQFSPSAVMHHDCQRLSNGNTLLLCRGDVLEPSISPVTLKDDFLVEVDASGQVVWVWDTYQHFTEFGFDSQALDLISAQGGDWAHANSAIVIPPNSHSDPALREGNVIVSHRYSNTVFIIDRDTDSIVWQVGPEQDQLTYGQHTAHMIEQGLPGAGNILVFDNGSGTGYPLNGRAPGNSRVVEIDPVTKTVAWEYKAQSSGQFRHRFTSYIVSGAQRLQSGNTLICSGVKGRLFEVEATGQIVWEYMSPFTSQGRGTLVYRAFRVPFDWPPSLARPVRQVRLR